MCCRHDKLAMTIGDLYAKRSALVHKGQRNVSWTEAKHVHKISGHYILEYLSSVISSRLAILSLASCFGKLWIALVEIEGLNLPILRI